mgnify:CR=1 FL=1
MKLIALAIIAVGMGYLACKFGDKVAAFFAIVATLMLFFS